MKRVLITGGTGTIGKSLIERLSKREYMLRLLVLPDDVSAKNLNNSNIEIRYGDISDPTTISGICKDIDIVLHMAAVVLSDDDTLFDRINVMGTRYLLADAEKYKVKHFIYVSSASVVYKGLTPYSRSKRIAEYYVNKSSLQWTIVRPTLVYGEKGGAEFDMFLSYLNNFPIIPFIGKGKALKRPVYVGDIIDGFEKLIEKGEGKRKIYNFSGPVAISIIDFAKLCLTFLGKENKPIIPIPVTICKIISLMLRKIQEKPLLKWNMIAGMIYSADISPKEAIEDLGYSPSPLEERLFHCLKHRQSVGYYNI